jgi:hypothetical protein
MRPPRFTIAGLMGLVVVVAVGVAALRFASDLWAGVLLMLTLGTLGAAVLAFHERAGVKRAWWRGFALFGWGYLALAMGPWAAETIAPHLPTSMGLDALYARMHPAAETHYIKRVVSLSPLRLSTSSPPPEPFRRVGHCLWALLAACVGGVVGRAFHAAEERWIDRPGP